MGDGVLLAENPPAGSQCDVPHCPFKAKHIWRDSQGTDWWFCVSHTDERLEGITPDGYSPYGKDLAKVRIAHRLVDDEPRVAQPATVMWVEFVATDGSVFRFRSVQNYSLSGSLNDVQRLSLDIGPTGGVEFVYVSSHTPDESAVWDATPEERAAADERVRWVREHGILSSARSAELDAIARRALERINAEDDR